MGTIFAVPFLIECHSMHITQAPGGLYSKEIVCCHWIDRCKVLIYMSLRRSRMGGLGGSCSLGECRQAILRPLSWQVGFAAFFWS